MKKEPRYCSVSGSRWVMPEVTRTKQAPSVNDPEVTELASTLHINRLLAAVLAGRGMQDAARARSFIQVGPDMMHDPMLLPDMEAAVDLIAEAIDTGTPIRLHGDYDADGVTSCALLQRALTALGARVDAFVPHRLSDGYGVSRKAIDKAAAEGVRLLLTCDCGSGSPKEIAHARRMGLKVVITDHHLPSQEPRSTGDSASDTFVPEVNPRRHDSEYPFPDLSGVGVTFKLIEALAARRGIRGQSHWRFLDLVALGTVADVSSLLDENRFLVKKGLELIGQSKKLGIVSLLKAAGVLPPISSRHISFVLAPRINAAGRLAHATDALKLLTTLDQAEADALAATLCEHNRARQGEEGKTLQEALEQAKERNLAEEKVLVLAGVGWHPGVIGIVASRLVELYNRPVLLAALPTDRDERPYAIGSARAIPGFPMWDALHACRNFLLRYGGHDQAGGFSVLPEYISALRDHICAFATEYLFEENLRTLLSIDAEASLDDFTLPAVEELEKLEPFGADNQPPVFIVKGTKVVEISQVGDGGAHLRVVLQGPSGRAVRTIWFRAGNVAGKLSLQQEVDVCINPGVQFWNGSRSVEFRLKDIAVPEEVKS